MQKSWKIETRTIQGAFEPKPTEPRLPGWCQLPVENGDCGQLSACRLFICLL